MHWFKRLLFILLLGSCVMSTIAQAEKTVVFAVDLFRHGDRTPIFPLPNFLFDWKFGNGELTPRGMLQQFQIGAHLRELYVEKHHLLPDRFPNDSIYVRAKAANRMRMSAQYAFLGLYPGGAGLTLENFEAALLRQHQTLPIETVPAEQDTLLTPDASPKFLEILRKYVFPSEQWQRREFEVAEKLERWARITGVPIHELFDLHKYDFGLHFFIRNLYNVPLPDGISVDEGREISELGDWVYVNFTKSRMVGILTANEFLSTLSNYLQQARRNETSLKYVMYQASDTTLSFVLSALDSPLDERPSYGSNLKFLLFSDGEVGVSYNGVTRAIPNCSTSGACTLENFVDLVSRIMLEAAQDPLNIAQKN